jgi:hypothetical protein
MRHFLAPCPIAPHPFGMFVAPSATALVASASIPERAQAGQIRAFFTAVDLAVVARRTHEDARAAVLARAKEEPANRHDIHRLAPSSRSDMDNHVLQMGYSVRIPCSGFAGRDTYKTCRFGSVSRPPLCGNIVLLQLPLHVIRNGQPSPERNNWYFPARQNPPLRRLRAGHVVRPDDGRPPPMAGQATAWPAIRRRYALVQTASTRKGRGLLSVRNWTWRWFEA